MVSTEATSNLLPGLKCPLLCLGQEGVGGGVLHNTSARAFQNPYFYLQNGDFMGDRKVAWSKKW